MDLLGVGHGGKWFRDTETLLRSIVVYRHGIDPYTLPYDDQLWYSHWWLWLEPTGVTLADTFWVGAVVSGFTVLTVWLVTRPRNWREVAWTLLVFCSAPVLLGLNRANVDLVLFIVLSACVPALTARGRMWRILATPLLIALATGLKYYPAVAGLVLLALPPRRERNVAILLYAVLLAGVLLDVATDISYYTDAAPINGVYTFGAPALSRALGLTTLAGLGLTLGILGGSGLWLARRPALRDWSVPPELRTEYLSFILGAVVLAGCFVLTVNYAYRWIFAFWLMPFLCRLATGDRTLRRLRNATLALLVAALWLEACVVAGLNSIMHTEATNIRWENIAQGLVQGVTWLLFACLGGWLTHFVLTQCSFGSSRRREAPGLEAT